MNLSPMIGQSELVASMNICGLSMMIQVSAPKLLRSKVLQISPPRRVHLPVGILATPVDGQLAAAATTLTTNDFLCVAGRVVVPNVMPVVYM